jgi:hypothetical protein
MDVKLFRGDTWLRTWVLKDATEAPINLTGASARLYLRDSQQTIVLQATSANNLLTITPLEGRIDLQVPYSQMNLPIGKYKFDLEVTHANGVRKTYEQNMLQLLEDVTYD